MAGEESADAITHSEWGFTHAFGGKEDWRRDEAVFADESAGVTISTEDGQKITLPGTRVTAISVLERKTTHLCEQACSEWSGKLHDLCPGALLSCV